MCGFTTWRVSGATVASWGFRRVMGLARTSDLLRLAGGLVLATLVLAGCARTPTPALMAAATGPSALNQTSLDLKDASRGADEHPKLLQGFGGVYRDAELEGVLNGIVADLVPASERPDLRYQVTILNSPSVNAFALPGGYLYVTRGLLALTNDESEIAAVLAHEMAHVTARHAALREEQAESAKVVSHTLAVFKDERAGADALKHRQATLAGFSRQQELDADAVGIATIARAGYDPNGAVRFLASMGRQARLDEGGDGDEEPMASHPTTPERLERATALARNPEVGPGPGIVRSAGVKRAGRDAYLAALDGLVYGDDASQGFARGRRFVHPELGFTFDAPEGFALQNGPVAVVRRGQGGEALRFEQARIPGGGPPLELVTNGLEDAQVVDVRPIIIDGLPAATALAKAGEWTFRVGAIRRGEMVYRFFIGAKSFSPDLDRVFLEAIRSFRRVAPGDTRLAKPLRLRVVRLGEGENATGLARRMATTGGDKLERLLILNGVKSGGTLRSGSQIKLVTEL